MTKLHWLPLLCAFAAASPVGTAARAQTPDPAAVKAGEALFSDTKLSASGTVSCATCHPDNGHTDNKTYVGLNVVADGDPNGRSTPTLWGAGTRSAYSWAGTAPSLEANIRGIIVNRMRGPEPSQEQLGTLASYVRSLPPRPAAFIGKEGAPAQNAPDNVKRGFDLFIGKGGCSTCHLAPSFDKKDVEDVGSGGKFKVPALWAVSKTGPWFHDGRYKTLDEAVTAMWEFQTKRAGTPSTPTASERADLVAYLSAL